jgi:NifU-like protein
MTETTASATTEFATLSPADQVARIEAVLDKHIRAGLASDGGGMTIEDWDGTTLKVKYLGACVGCKAAAGATLFHVETTLNRELGSRMKVSPA